VRCQSCRKDFATEDAYARHASICDGPKLPEDGAHAIQLPDGLGCYCWACGRNRGTYYAEPDFCCRTCRAVLLTVGPLD
jgi:hypothetical protein